MTRWLLAGLIVLLTTTDCIAEVERYRRTGNPNIDKHLEYSPYSMLDDGTKCDDQIYLKGTGISAELCRELVERSNDQEMYYRLYGRGGGSLPPDIIIEIRKR
jgi:hypothetical protein